MYCVEILLELAPSIISAPAGCIMTAFELESIFLMTYIMPVQEAAVGSVIVRMADDASTRIV